MDGRPWSNDRSGVDRFRRMEKELRVSEGNNDKISRSVIKLPRVICFFLVLFISLSCSNEQETEFEEVKIAFIADAHFQDIYADFEDANYKGIKNPETGDFVNIRTMNAQLKSTRIFNENYFAFIEALEDIVARGIKYVALPGDFSDDGQPVHVKGLRKILNQYSKKYGLLFFATTGNHDPVKPFEQDAGKTDFLGVGGKEQIITSRREKVNNIPEGELTPVITEKIKKWGYKDILNEMSAFGFYPQKEYLYWETPFSKYTYNEYTFGKAEKAAVLGNRTYAIDDYNKHPDASYLVEPTAGIWLLAIDANVYLPKEKMISSSESGDDFESASIGYNNVILQKRHLIDWVKKVAEKANKMNKVLIAFSHYPMVDFNDGAATEMKHFFGEKKMQLHRVPNVEVAETFADAGIQIHFGGHMHINDTGVYESAKGNTLFNIQTPSLAAYAPGYKVLSIRSKTRFEVETVVIEKAKDFNSLFSLYEEEYAYLLENETPDIWNKDILTAENYRDFTQWHLKELVRLRFIPDDWSREFLTEFVNKTGKELILEYSGHLDEETNNIVADDFQGWTGFDMIYDFYRLRSADELAKVDIGNHRLQQYKIVCNQLKTSHNKAIGNWAVIFEKAMNGEPSEYFVIDIIEGSIKEL
ncbi:metallophosphoesterase [Maribacter sp.]|uniref:metallophosphoesterase n=1 Tax=Maribacter sp. TaxID=1897614 RepID=UPI00329A009E